MGALSWGLDLANFEGVPVRLAGFEMENVQMLWSAFIAQIMRQIRVSEPRGDKVLGFGVTQHDTHRPPCLAPGNMPQGLCSSSAVSCLRCHSSLLSLPRRQALRGSGVTVGASLTS